MPAKAPWNELSDEIIGCERCPRLRHYCLEIARVKKREFREWDYWGRPVPGFGDPEARLWIVGLAPAAHGANRTGRMFTGDSSGRWLYRALYRAGFANQPSWEKKGDGLVLKDVFISAAVRCAPPANKPLLEEIRECAPYLDREFALLKRAHVFLAAGALAFRAISDLLGRHGIPIPKPRSQFAHGAVYDWAEKTILVSYHPSRQNTQTGVLTETMWDNIFLMARELVSIRRRPQIGA
jgi:uracil-DNA glycosylase